VYPGGTRYAAQFEIHGVYHFFFLNNKNARQPTTNWIGLIDMHQGLTVWSEGDGRGSNQVYLHNGSTVQNLSNNIYNNIDPKVNNGQVIWRRSSEPGQFGGFPGYICLWKNGSPVQIINSTDPTYYYPFISNGQIAYMGTFSGGSGTLAVKSYSNGTTTELLNLGPVYFYNWRFSAGNFAKTTSTDRYLREKALSVFANGESKLLYRYPRDGEDPQFSIDGNQVVWTQLENGVRNLYYYDGLQTSVFVNNSSDNQQPFIQNGCIAWTSNNTVKLATPKVVFTQIGQLNPHKYGISAIGTPFEDVKVGDKIYFVNDGPQFVKTITGANAWWVGFNWGETPYQGSTTTGIVGIIRNR